MSRFHQCVLILATLAVSWLGMQALHEFGHVLGAGSAVGKSLKVCCIPPQYRIRAWLKIRIQYLWSWASPIVGVALPVAALAFVWLFSFPSRYLVQFFAGFCLIANGAYLGIGTLNHVGDAGDMLRHRAPIALLWIYGVITIQLGFWLWYDLGSHFGVGSAGGRVNRTTAYVMLSLVVDLVTLELVLD